MLNLELLARRFGNPGEGPPGGESGCPVQGGPGCATWGSGPVWGDGSKWCSRVGVPYEFVAEHEAHIHRLTVKIKYTYCHTPGMPEAFRIHELRARIAPDRQADYPYQAFIDGTTPTERLSMKLKYTAVAGAADSTDAAHHGSFVGTPTFHSASATGNGYGMGFGPAVSDAHVSVPHHADFAQAAFSVEFWARLDDATTNEWSTPVAKSTSNQWNDGWGFYDRQSTGEFTFWVDTYDAHPTPAASARYISIARPAPGVYHHYAGTFDGATLALYVDGALAGSTSAVPLTAPSIAPMLFGYGGFSQSGWPGTVDEVAYYSSALTAGQVLRHYETRRQMYRAAVLQDFPVSYWPLDEEGAYGNNFTLYNAQMTVQRKKHQPKG